MFYFIEDDRNDGLKFYMTANKWFGKVIMLCRDWNLNVELMRRHYVCDLFLFGCDPLAQEVPFNCVHQIFVFNLIFFSVNFNSH